jgi:hypothetical protein
MRVSHGGNDEFRDALSGPGLTGILYQSEREYSAVCKPVVKAWAQIS